MTETPWEKYKKERSAKPWDLLNPKIKYVEKYIQKERLAVCLECPELIRATKNCKQCGCFMTHKVKLPNAGCPLGKWGSIEVDNAK